MTESIRPDGADKIRVLLVAEAANPEWTSVPLVGWSHARALSKVADVHIVTQIRNKEAMLRAGLKEDKDFTAIDSEAVAKPMWKLSSLLRGGTSEGWTTLQALAPISYYYFEHLVWKKFGPQIKSKTYQIVHRLTPLSPTTPSLLAKKCSNNGISFVVGPLNGGLPWPKEFTQARKKEREWLVPLRSAYKLLPGSRSMQKHAAAILAGSKETLRQIPTKYHVKTVYLPENGIDLVRFPYHEKRLPKIPIKAVFVGRLVALKGVDMLLEAAASLIGSRKLQLEIIGDGPEKRALEEQAERLRLSHGAFFLGNVDHKDVVIHLNQADILTFPSIKDFGGAVVLEAMATGTVPVVVNYGGPAELVSADSAFTIELGPRDEIIAGLRKTLELIVADPSVLVGRSDKARKRTLQLFSWDAKAKQVLGVYHWVLGARDKPSYF